MKKRTINWEGTTSGTLTYRTGEILEGMSKERERERGGRSRVYSRFTCLRGPREVGNIIYFPLKEEII